DPAGVAAAVKPLLQFDSWLVRMRIVDDLGEAGRKGLPALRAVLKDDSLAQHHDDAILALAKAGGEGGGPELTDMIKQELAYWKKVGPGLQSDWWNGRGVEWEAVDGLRKHYGRVYAALQALKSIRFTGCCHSVTKFRAFWSSVPQLSEIDQL